MVNHEWMENKLMFIENARNKQSWTLQHEQTFQYLLTVYRTGHFEKLSKQQIINRLQQFK